MFNRWESCKRVPMEDALRVTGDMLGWASDSQRVN